MLRLRIAGVPVEVHVTHLIFMPLVGLFFSPKLGWAEHAPQWLVVVLGAAVVSSTLLMHELGHAFSARAFGYRPVVQLIGMSARTVPNANETVPWYREVIFHVAGPAVGLTVGFTVAALYLVLKQRVPAPLEYTLLLALSSNLIWAGVSLLPIHPLDGGRIATALAMRVFGRAGFLYAQLLGLTVGVSIAGLALAFRQPVGIFVLIYLAQTAVMIAAFRRGELPHPAAHPLEQAFAHAEGLYREDNFDEARRVLSPLLEADPQPQLRARVHLLLGWVAVKLGEGRRALEHFGQVSGEPVPPLALAAAHSLAADDARAEPLWRQAAHQTGDATVLHEWAGALIRLGREDEARQIPHLHLPAAYQAAQRVLAQRNDLPGAARAAESRFAADPSAARAYEAACCWALAGHPDDALRLLAAAIQYGFSDLQRVLHDDDLSSVRAHQGFSAVVEAVRGALKSRPADASR